MQVIGFEIDSETKRNKVNSNMADWKTFITNPATKKPFRGAINRIARKLKLHHGTVNRMWQGIAIPTIQENRKLQDLVHSRTVFAPKKRSDFRKKRAPYKKRLPVSS